MAEGFRWQRKTELEIARWKRENPGEEWSFAGAIDRLKRRLPPFFPGPLRHEPAFPVALRAAPELPPPPKPLLPPGAGPVRTVVYLSIGLQPARDDLPGQAPANEAQAPAVATEEEKLLAYGDRQLARTPKGKFAQAYRILLELGPAHWSEKREALVSTVEAKLGIAISRRRVSLVLDYIKAKAQRDGTVV